MNKSTITGIVREEALRLGFSAVGIARAEFLDQEAENLVNWLAKGMQGEMRYLERNFDKRVDPRKLVPGAKSVISLLHNYYSAEKQSDPAAPRISMYAHGRDYHDVIREKLDRLLQVLCHQVGEIEGRGFVDSAPVLERAWAVRSGLGWIGKNSCLLRRREGSYFFLSELIVDLELDYDQPARDLCARCRLCIDACPTQAIVEPRFIDASRCISYLTIEYRGKLPLELAGKFKGWVFGCDICQDVCPYNRRARPHTEPQFNMSQKLRNLATGEWQGMTAADFEELFGGSAVKRTGYDGLRRNINFVIGANGNDEKSK